MSSKEDQKWESEKKTILSVLNIVLPESSFELKKGDDLNNEPDGIIKINEKIIGLELTRIHNYDEAIQRESELNKAKVFIQGKLDQTLS